MLKQFRLRKKKEVVAKELKQLFEENEQIEERKKALEPKVEAANTREEIEAVEKEVDEVEKDAAEIQAQIEEHEAEIKKLEEELAAIEKEGDAAMRNKRNVNLQSSETRDAVTAYVRSRGTEKREGIKTTEIGVVIPKEILTKPIELPDTVTDLSKFVTRTAVTKSSGTTPVLKQSTAKLVSVEELEKNPELAKPQFTQVEWKVETYRGAIPVSEEAIDDADIDVMGMVAKSAMRQKLNTTNHLILQELKKFTPKTATTLDELKKIKNVDLDAGYNLSFVITQSAYQVVDTLKDNNGKYIYQESIKEGSPSILLGKPCFIVEDTALGAEGDAVMFVGDMEAAIHFADRKDVMVQWVDNGIYGRNLLAGFRAGFKQLDDKAGFLVTCAFDA